MFSDPITGFRASTNFMLFCIGEKPRPIYKFSYIIEPNLPVDIQSTLSDNRIQLKLDVSSDLYNGMDYITVKLKCELVDENGKSEFASTKIKLYNRFSDLKENFNSTVKFVDQLLNLSEQELFQQVSLIGSLGYNIDQQQKSYHNITLITRSQVNGKEVLVVEDPVCKEGFSTEYCNGNGNCVIIDRGIGCKCFSGYVGFYCQIKESDAEFTKQKFGKTN